MSNKSQENAELVSALLDGQLRGEEFGRALDYLAESQDAMETWNTYHLVGEALRSGSANLRPHDPLFVQRLCRNIALINPEFEAQEEVEIRVNGQNDHKVESANDPWWQPVAGFASVLLVAVLAWQGQQFLTDGLPPLAAPQLTQLPPQPAAPGLAAQALIPSANTPMALTEAGVAAVIIRDPQLDSLLAAHRQFGGTSALQMPSGFLRNATFEGGSR